MEDIKRDLEENIRKGTFFSFDKMITPAIIKVIFIIGIALTTLTGLGLIISGLGARFGGGLQVFMGLIIILVGPIIVRVNCELMIILFKIHQALEEIRSK